MYKIIRDTREKDGQGWFFDDSAECEGTVVKKLAIGDYSIDGLEHLFSIERKRNTSEFAINIIEPRFERELEKLNKLEYAYVILEFTDEDMHTFPENSGIPQFIWSKKENKEIDQWANMKISAKFLRKRLYQFREKYTNITFLLVGDEGFSTAKQIIREVYGKAKEELGT